MTRPALKIGVLGQPCLDSIVKADGSRSQSVGGILYSFAAMDRYLRERSPESSFAALTWHSSPDDEVLAPFYASLERLDRNSGLWKTDRLTNRVELVYHTDSARTEHCPTILPALTSKELGAVGLPAYDGIFINMISGFDISLKTMKWLAKQSAGNRPHLHLDIHALSLGDLSLGEGDAGFGSGRTLGPIPDWREWITSAHSVQLNEAEAQAIASRSASGEQAFLDEARMLVRRTSSPTEIIIVTRAERGASLYFMQSDEVIHAAAPRVNVIDTTGSGDVFGSVFLTSYLIERSYASALNQAVDWASWNATLESIEQIGTAPLPDRA